MAEENASGSDTRPVLRVTMRCGVEDLGLSAHAVEGPVTEIEHELVRKFVELRAQDPRGTQKVQPLDNASEVYTLHAGRWRGATWHVQANNAVWLLAGGFHRSGERTDAYPHFKQLDAAGRLAPTEEDYELLFHIQERTFAEAVLEEAEGLVRQARAVSPAEVRSILGGTVPVSVAVLREADVELLYLAVSMRLEEGGLRPPAEWLPILWAAFFPWVEEPLTDLSPEEEIGGRPRMENELIFAALRELE